MERYPKLIWPAYLVAFMLVVIPLFDAVMSVYPFSPWNEQWRFGALGLLSNAFMIPAIGLLIALTTAVMYDHVRFLRVLGFVCTLAGAFVGLMILLFALDSVQAQANITPDASLPFVVASITAVVKMVLATLSLLFTGVAGLKITPRVEKGLARHTPLVAGHSAALRS